MFIRITACWLADPLPGLLHQGLRTFHRFHARLGCYRLERKLPGGFIYSPTGVLHLSTAHSKHALRSNVWAIVPLAMRGPATVFTHRGLPCLAEAFSEGRSPHQFTP